MANSKVKPIPDGYHGIIPYISVKGAAAAIDFYKRGFGAVEMMRLVQPDGKIGHAELLIGDARLMLADEFPEIGFRGPQSLGGSPVILHLYVEDVDALMAQAVANGATITRPVENQFHGDRLGQIADPFGHSWSFSTRIEDVSPQEMTRRMKEMGGGT
jgi:PhnB protein